METKKYYNQKFYILFAPLLASIADKMLLGIWRLFILSSPGINCNKLNILLLISEK